MQLENSNIIENKLKSNDENLLIEILADKHSRAILSISTDMEFSACWLIQELGIPKATVYRKLKLLEDTGLIKHVKTVINLSGNEEKYYRCLLNDATVNLISGKLSVNLNIDKTDYGDKIAIVWQRLHSNIEAKDRTLPDSAVKEGIGANAKSRRNPAGKLLELICIFFGALAVSFLQNLTEPAITVMSYIQA